MAAKPAAHGADGSHPGVECRICERYPSEIDTSCQPIAARRDNDLTWPAKIRDISLAGIGLILERRFERGAALAIELPDPANDAPHTVFARVVHTTAWSGGSWLLGCKFLNPLGDETLEALRRYARQQ